MRTSVILLVTAVALACVPMGVEPVATSEQPAEQMERLLAGVEVFFENRQLMDSSHIAVRAFAYKDKQHRTPYGHGFALFDAESGKLLWIHLIPGDYPPHHWRWVDFDGDGKLDILYFSGEEDVTETHVILDRLAAREFALTNFFPGLSIGHAYAVVVEGPRDDLPDLLHPLEGGGNVDFEQRCIDGESATALRRAVAAEFLRVAGRFQALNLPANSTDLFLFDKVRFVNLRNGWWRDVTERHSEHLRWRLSVLKTIRPLESPGCKGLLDGLVSHLEETLSRMNPQ